MKPTDLFPDSLALFTAFAKDSGNWSGTPMIDITPEQRGNLTDLKRKGLVTTSTDEGIQWLSFTALGKELAKEIGHEI